jgi:hypothetical protein
VKEKKESEREKRGEMAVMLTSDDSTSNTASIFSVVGNDVPINWEKE